jgi:hypothetical protein
MASIIRKLKNASTKRKIRKNATVAKQIGKKALKAGLVAGGMVAAQVALKEVAARRRLRKPA